MKCSLTSPVFWVDVGERVVRGFASGTAGALGVGAAGITHMPWVTALDIGAGAAALTLLGCLASLPLPHADPETGSMLPPPQQTAARIKSAFAGR